MTDLIKANETWGDIRNSLNSVLAATPDSFSGNSLTEKVQAAFDSDAPEIFLPPNTVYELGPILLRPRKRVFGTKSTLVRPKLNGQKLFYTDDNDGRGVSSKNYIQIENLAFAANGKKDVTFLDLPEVRNGCQIRNLLIDGSDKKNGCTGLRLPKLNWNNKLENVEGINLATGVKLESAAACIILLNFTMQRCAVGFDLDGSDKSIDLITEVRILGPTVCQLNDIGVRTRLTTRTFIDSLHFENNGIDIDADGDDSLLIQNIAMRGNNTGLASVGIRLRNTVGTRITNPVMAGHRQLGFFDVDTTNTLAKLFAQVRNGRPSLNGSFLSYPGTTDGLMCVSDDGTYADAGDGQDAYLFADFFALTLNDGKPVSLSPKHFLDGQTVKTLVRCGPTWSSADLKVANIPIDMTHAGPNKYNFIEVTKYSALGGLGWVLKSQSGWLTA